MFTMMKPLLTLCLVAAVTESHQSRVTLASTRNTNHSFIEKEVMYNLNPFDLVFTSTHHEFFATGEASPFDNIKSEIRIITGWYLEAFIDNLIYQTGLGFQEVNSVDLQVSFFRPEKPGDERRLQQPEHWGFRAEIYGICKFLEDEYEALPTREQVERVLNQLVRDAFAQSSLQLYIDQMKDSPDEVLANIVTLRVETDEVAPYQPPDGETMEEGGGGGGGWDTKAYVLCFLMAGFFIAGLVCLYMFLSRQYHDRKGSKDFLATDHYLDDMNQMLPQQNGAQESNRYLSPDRPTLDRRLLFSSDPKQNGSGSNENVIPVPAPMDKHRNLHDLGDGGQTPRRYIKSSSPFEMLYGASFLHGSTVRGTKRKARRSSRKAPSSSIRPMLSIAEEEHPGGHAHDHYAVSPAAGVTSWIRQWTGHPDESLDKFQHDNVPASSPTGVDEVGVFYRDFPRHDGTPCLIYNSTHGGSLEHGIEVNDDNGSLKLSEVYIRDSSYHSTGSMLSLASTQSNHSSGDEGGKFVVKLEHLMEMRQKQYRERMQMEEEKAAYAKKRQENRTPRAKTRRSLSMDVQEQNGRNMSSGASVGAASVPHSSSSRGTSHGASCVSPSDTEATIPMDTDSVMSGQPKSTSLSDVRRQQERVIT